eukprot:CAMPEP_0170169044 /NCGR_PEP_ID=MMETSP0040_2-20121228/1985_1 /TAXON_ID=641309 /ORGANISM="Lotharella oceanica, Strain CCMP622" /LENGTH=160 /DNA_ID=CAMNT_0010407567 /DNA_START=8 /DNA_END=490 /DNA_ORIENTATION=-
MEVQSWGLDPIFWSFAKLTIHDILHMGEMANVRGAFSLHGRPVSRAEIVGYIVEVVAKHNRIMYSVDDGSGVISCTQFMNPNVSQQGCKGKLGEVCRIRGTLSKFRGNMEIRIADFSIEKDPNQQTLHWLEALQALVEVYKHPSVIQTECKGNNASQVSK